MLAFRVYGNISGQLVNWSSCRNLREVTSPLPSGLLLGLTMLSSLRMVFPFEAELLATSLAINYAWNLGWHKIWLQSDSSYVAQLLSVRSDHVTWRVRQAWQCCIHQISHIEFQVSHIFREGNQEADSFFKHALGLSFDYRCSSTPSFCSSLVCYDCMGRESFRFS
ncbi:hypothetical protein Ddye_024157 [Dipteronia dyeriana]|uniref:RNase H type-1 domain-containing protein n=1 Tax=Dipteronia dyeriana TaxID=168575 RepID=A0AAD9TV92_9ROSI|nr:hypothetical protein Ddye_024157 [Dipteronia dyeriana]